MPEEVTKVLNIFSDSSNADKAEALSNTWPELAEALSDAKGLKVEEESEDDE